MTIMSKSTQLSSSASSPRGTTDVGEVDKNIKSGSEKNNNNNNNNKSVKTVVTSINMCESENNSTPNGDCNPLKNDIKHDNNNDNETNHDNQLLSPPETLVEFFRGYTKKRRANNNNKKSSASGNDINNTSSTVKMVKSTPVLSSTTTPVKAAVTPKKRTTSRRRSTATRGPILPTKEVSCDTFIKLWISIMNNLHGKRYNKISKKIIENIFATVANVNINLNEIKNILDNSETIMLNDVIIKFLYNKNDKKLSNESLNNERDDKKNGKNNKNVVLDTDSVKNDKEKGKKRKSKNKKNPTLADNDNNVKNSPIQVNDSSVAFVINNINNSINMDSRSSDNSLNNTNSNTINETHNKMESAEFCVSYNDEIISDEIKNHHNYPLIKKYTFNLLEAIIDDQRNKTIVSSFPIEILKYILKTFQRTIQTGDFINSNIIQQSLVTMNNINNNIGGNTNAINNTHQDQSIKSILKSQSNNTSNNNTKKLSFVTDSLSPVDFKNTTNEIDKYENDNIVNKIKKQKLLNNTTSGNALNNNNLNSNHTINSTDQNEALLISSSSPIAKKRRRKSISSDDTPIVLNSNTPISSPITPSVQLDILKSYLKNPLSMNKIIQNAKPSDSRAIYLIYANELDLENNLWDLMSNFLQIIHDNYCFNNTVAVYQNFEINQITHLINTTNDHEHHDHFTKTINYLLRCKKLNIPINQTHLNNYKMENNFDKSNDYLRISLKQYPNHELFYLHVTHDSTFLLDANTININDLFQSFTLIEHASNITRFYKSVKNTLNMTLYDSFTLLILFNRNIKSTYGHRFTIVDIIHTTLPMNNNPNNHNNSHNNDHDDNQLALSISKSLSGDSLLPENYFQRLILMKNYFNKINNINFLLNLNAPTHNGDGDSNNLNCSIQKNQSIVICGDNTKQSLSTTKNQIFDINEIKKLNSCIVSNRDSLKYFYNNTVMYFPIMGLNTNRIIVRPTSFTVGICGFHVKAKTVLLCVRTSKKFDKLLIKIQKPSIKQTTDPNDDLNKKRKCSLSSSSDLSSSSSSASQSSDDNDDKGKNTSNKEKVNRKKHKKIKRKKSKKHSNTSGDSSSDDEDDDDNDSDEVDELDDDSDEIEDFVNNISSNNDNEISNNKSCVKKLKKRTKKSCKLTSTKNEHNNLDHTTKKNIRKQSECNDNNNNNNNNIINKKKNATNDRDNDESSNDSHNDNDNDDDAGDDSDNHDSIHDHENINSLILVDEFPVSKLNRLTNFQITISKQQNYNTPNLEQMSVNNYNFKYNNNMYNISHSLLSPNSVFFDSNHSTHNQHIIEAKISSTSKVIKSLSLKFNNEHVILFKDIIPITMSSFPATISPLSTSPSSSVTPSSVITGSTSTEVLLSNKMNVTNKSSIDSISTTSTINTSELPSYYKKQVNTIYYQDITTFNRYLYYNNSLPLPIQSKKNDTPNSLNQTNNKITKSNVVTTNEVDENKFFENLNIGRKLLDTDIDLLKKLKTWFEFKSKKTS